MSTIETAQDLVEAFEGMLDGEVVIMIPGDDKQYSVREVSRRAYRFPTPKIIVRCEERKKLE